MGRPCGVPGCGRGAQMESWDQTDDPGFLLRTKWLPLLLAAVLLAACGGGTSLQDYFAELAERNADLHTRSADAQATAQSAFAQATTEEEAAAVMTRFLTEYADIGDSAVTSLEALDAPEEARSQHEAYVAATEDLLSEFQALLRDVREADPAEAEATFQSASADIDDRSRAVDDACMDLQNLAEDSDLNSDLQCGASGTQDAAGGSG